MTLLLWRHEYIERSQLVQYFAHSFTTCQMLLPHAGQTVWETRLLRSLDHIGQVSFYQQHFLVHKQTYFTKHVSLVLKNTCHHIAYWTHLRVNGIWATAFAQRKWTTVRCSLRYAFSRNARRIYYWQMTSQWSHRNKIYSLLFRIKLRTKPIFRMFHI